MISYFRQSLGHRHNLAHSLMYQAEAAMLEGEYRDADEKLQEASTILEEIGFSGLASGVRLQQAELYFADGNLEASLREARHVADAFAEQEALPQLARAALLQARIAANLGDTTSAEYLCHQALDIAQGQDLLDLEYRCDYLLGQIAEHHGDLKGAANYYDRAMNSIITKLWPTIEHTVLMLEYYLTEQDLYIFEITRDGIDVHVVEDAVPKLERLLSLWRVNLDLAAQASGARDRAQAFAGLQENCLGLLQRLYDLLLRPVSSALESCEHLTIVPYGMLHYLPFHCLFDGVQFVIERLEVSYLPSAALMEICHQRGQRAGANRLPLKKSLVMGLSDGGRLAFAVQEAEAVARQLGAW